MLSTLSSRVQLKHSSKTNCQRVACCALVEVQYKIYNNESTILIMLYKYFFLVTNYFFVLKVMFVRVVHVCMLLRQKHELG